jgi:hypothetical protein
MRDRLIKSWRVIAGWALVLAGVVLLALGWYGVSGDPDVARQLSYLVSGGLGGLLTGIVGVALLVSDDLRSDRERLGRVESAMLEVRDVILAERAAREAERERVENVENGAVARKPARAKKAGV